MQHTWLICSNPWTLSTYCTDSFEKGYIPFLIAVYEYWSTRRERSRDVRITPPVEDPDEWGIPRLSPPRFNNHQLLVPSLLLGLSASFAAALLQNPRSTYICPSSTYGPALVPALQTIGAMLSSYILIKTTSILRVPSSETASSKMNPILVLGSVLLVSLRNPSLLGY